MKTVRKLLALLMACIMLFALVACGKGGDVASDSNNTPGSGDTGGNAGGGGDSGGAAAGRDTINIAMTQDSGSLHPHQNTGTDVFGIMNGLLYEPLWFIDNSGELVYKLATGYDIVADSTMHIYLREGVTFSDGSTFDAEDALFSMISWNNREGQQGIFPQMDMENSKVIDQYTLELVLVEFNINLLSQISWLSMFNKETYDATSLAMTPNGTGPYVLEEYVVNSHLYVTRRDDYWGPAPRTKNFHFLQLNEEPQIVKAIQTGAVHLARIPFQDVEFVQSLPGITVDLIPSEDQQAVLFNISNYSVFFENRDARRAVAHAIDRDAIIRAVYFDFANKAIMPGPATCYDVDERFYNIGPYGSDGYNPDLARELAVSSGLVDMEIRFINNGDSRIVLMAEIIQANLRDIGVTCNVTNLDMGSWVQNLFDETAWDMCIDYSWAQNLLYSGNLRYMVRSMSAESYKNNPWEGSERALYLIVDGPELLTTIFDVDRRRELNLEITHLVINEMLWFGIVDEVYTWALSSDLRGDAKDYAGDMKLFFNLYWD